MVATTLSGAVMPMLVGTIISYTFVFPASSVPARFIALV